MKCGALYVTTLVLLSSTASAEEVTQCNTPQGYTSLYTRADLPTALQDRFKNFAMPNESFNAGDVGEPGRGIFSMWRRNHRWILEIGYGGIALRIDVVAFEVSADGKAAVSLMPLKDDAFTCKAVREYAAMPVVSRVN